MNYELAKKLKDAGYPQKGSAHPLVLNPPGPPPKGIYSSESAINPTLEELIDACGDYLGDITKTDEGWYTNAENAGNYPQSDGSTPSEAVANLWLALNSK